MRTISATTTAAAFCLAVLRAAGSTTEIDFENARAVRLGAGAAGIAAADFDGDGRLDLAFSHDSPAFGASIVINDGTGRFGPASTLASGTNTLSPIATSDFDEDGSVDIVRANSNGTLTLLLGDGAGGFSGASTLVLPGAPYAVLADDFSGDGHADLVFALTARDTVGLRTGIGNGGFAPTVEFPAGSGPWRMAAADFDRDGDPDVAVANYGGAAFSFLANDGAGALVLAGTFASVSGARGIATADFDADGDEDVVVFGYTKARVHKGDGGGGFVSAGDAASGTSFESIATGDFDRDGRADFAVVDEPGTAPWSRVLVLSGNGAGGFAPSDALPLGYSLHATIHAADLDADGTLDLVVGLGGVGPEAIVAFGDVVTGFGRSKASATPGAPFAIAPADFDEDGRLDLAILYQFRRNGLAFGDGAGGFAAAPDLFIGFGPSAVLPFDANGDGHADLVVVDEGGVSREEEVFDSGLWVALGDGAGGLGASVFHASLGDARAGSVADVNGDLAPDVVLAHFRGETLTVMLNDGSGAFAPGAGSTPFGRRLESVRTGDFDEDGAPDAVVGFNAPFGQSVQSVGVALGDGAGGFLAPVEWPTSSTDGRPVVVVDLDADGHLDLLVAGVGGTSVLYGLGDGGFEAPLPLATYVTPRLPLVADVDEDGVLDVSVGTAGGVAIWRGLGGRAFHEVARFRLLATVGADFDGDAHVDLVCFDASSEAIVFARNRSFDPIDSRRGNVNAGAGSVADVLRVNGAVGDGAERRVVLATTDPFEIAMDRPPSKLSGTSRFALYLTVRPPSVATADTLPSGLGRAAIQTPLTGGRPNRVWNNIGSFAKLGLPNRSSTPAPSVVLRRDAGLGRAIRFFLQGFIVDSAAPNGLAATTNAIEVKVE